MGEPARKRYTWDEYLDLEEASEEKHEFLDGEIFTMGEEIYGMAGGDPEHAWLTMQIGSALVVALKGRPCRVYSADLRIRIEASGLGTYPDVAVVCGRPDTGDRRSQGAANPTAVIEVLSPSTASWDRGGKFDHYKKLPTLREYVLVEVGKNRVERYHKDEAGRWIHEAWGPGGVITLPSLEVSIPLDELYAGVEDVRDPSAEARMR